MRRNMIKAAEGGGGFLFQDTFTDADGVLLTNHPPETGGAWENYQGTSDIKSNGAKPKTNGVGGECQQVALASASDGVITSEAAHHVSTGYIVRAADANNFFLIVWSSVAQFQIFERLGGTFFLRTNSNFVIANFIEGVLYPWEITLSGQLISVTVTGDSGVCAANYSSSNNQTSKKIGIRTNGHLPTTPVFAGLEMV